MKIFYISEAISAPFDEGVKNLVFSLYKQFINRKNILTVTRRGNNTDGLKIRKISLNKFFINTGLLKCIRKFAPDIVLYIPSASYTFNSFIRAKVLKIIGRNAKVVMLGVQVKKCLFFQHEIIARYLGPDLVFLLGKTNQDFFKEKRIKFKVLPPAVDTGKFCPASEEEKKAVREEYKIPLDMTVVLHVGHIKINRNIETLLKVQKLHNVQVVIVGSTSITVEHNLKRMLINAGIMVIDRFIHDISKIYKMSDIYVFPVIQNNEAIDMPLSVFEAMACNLSIMTTRFGCLEENFTECAGFRYFDNDDELVELIRSRKDVPLHNDKKMRTFTWERFVDQLIDTCRELI